MQRKNLMAACGRCALLCPRWRADTVAEPAGYRMEEYRAPVPATLRGAQVVTTQEAAALWKEKSVIFFDVMPHTPKPAKLPAGTIWREKVRKNIPGSIWLPNVGYGAISKDDAQYFKAGIDAKTGGDKSAACCSTA